MLGHQCVVESRIHKNINILLQCCGKNDRNSRCYQHIHLDLQKNHILNQLIVRDYTKRSEIALYENCVNAVFEILTTTEKVVVCCVHLANYGKRPWNVMPIF